ncbi:MAG: 50S ribosomal protein L32e [Nanoarchaeota archaeon]
MDALKLRKELKKKKPDFRRQDSHKKGRLSRTGYRKPRGRHSKMRLNLRGYVRQVSPGYGSPSEAKYKDPSGLIPFIVSTPAQLERIDPKTEGVIIASTVGVRKRIEIVSAAQEKKLTLLNIKDPAAFLADAEKSMKERKQKKAQLAKKREEAKKQKESKQKEEESKKDEPEAAEISADEKKAAEKKEKDKVLTKKDD